MKVYIRILIFLGIIFITFIWLTNLLNYGLARKLGWNYRFGLSGGKAFITFIPRFDCDRIKESPLEGFEVINCENKGEKNKLILKNITGETKVLRKDEELNWCYYMMEDYNKEEKLFKQEKEEYRLSLLN
mgnify:CR=1 FL=1